MKTKIILEEKMMGLNDWTEKRHGDGRKGTERKWESKMTHYNNMFTHSLRNQDGSSEPQWKERTHS